MAHTRMLEALCMLVLGAAAAQAGEIAGTVHGPGPGGVLEGIGVFAMDPSGSVAGNGVSAVTGAYTIPGLAPGIYYVHASVAFDNPDGYVGETYARLPCTTNCNLRAGTEVEVGAGTTAGIDLEIRVGGTIAGRSRPRAPASPSWFRCRPSICAATSWAVRKASAPEANTPFAASRRAPTTW